MHTNRHISRALAAAVASSGFLVAPLPALAVTQLVCAPGSFQANADSVGNITVTCTEKSGTSGGDSTGGGTTTPPPPPPPPPGGAIPASCTVNGATLTVLPYDLPWTAKSLITTKGFGNSAMVVARFTTPAASGIYVGGTLASAEYGSQRTTRSASISTVPCDLTGQGGGASLTQTPGWSYQVGGTCSGSILRSGCSGLALQPNTTYYINIVNRDSRGSQTCTSSTCDMIVQLTKPPGL